MFVYWRLYFPSKQIRRVASMKQLPSNVALFASLGGYLGHVDADNNKSRKEDR